MSHEVDMNRKVQALNTKELIAIVEKNRNKVLESQ